MNNVLGFFILSRVWQYLAERRPFESAPVFLISELQIAIICDKETNRAALRFLLECQDWRKVLGVAELIGEVAA